jgi:NAD+ kinase
MNFSIVSNPERVQWQAPVREAIKYLLGYGHNVFISQNLSGKVLDLPKNVVICATDAEVVSNGDIIIAVGGDGTMLHSARLVHDSGKPILGINRGKLGFLADTQPHQLHEALDQLMNGDWQTEARFMLKAEVQNKSYYAFNEFLFSKHANVSMITLEVYCDEIPVNKYWADGLIIASPTGSSAYNLSAGGPVILPETDVMVITAVCPHALTTRSLVLPANKSIRVKAIPEEQEILFSFDGKMAELQDKALDAVITKAPFETRLIRLPGRNYFETLRTKLMWGMDLRE